MIGLPRGVQDVMPPESKLWQFIEKTAREVFEKYNYQEIRTPIFEFTELFIKGTGETTDIVIKEMYTFLDKKGRSLTLRPEGTPGVVRAYIMNKIYNSNVPWKVYYFGPMFRYERPQAGRYRQFYQLGVEVLGIKDPIADFEIIKIAVDFLRSLNLYKIEVEINSIGCQKCRPIYRKVLVDYFLSFKNELSEIDKERLERNPLRLLDSKDEKMMPIKERAPSALEYICKECQEHFEKVKNYLSIANIPYKINSKLVRGLDYYTRTVFEITTDILGAQNAIGGGGRYDNLVEAYGGPPTPGLGFAFGIERLILLLSKTNLNLDKKKLIYLAILEENLLNFVVDLTEKLKNKNYIIELGAPSLSLKNHLKIADKLRAEMVIFIDSLLQERKIKVKKLNTGEEKILSFDNILSDLEFMI
ncbi:MAG: histidine--tRNA ligase [Dictyoglomus sp.]|nr:histidine--tRNA ligase [Dictyoglomus sp.]MCX7942720.1 histidine--tRNA ligase [Dictyoglomaceae bacterium]MDW8189266.1 histidine--tRNA ligase [Dictyoglomus sp.]